MRNSNKNSEKIKAIDELIQSSKVYRKSKVYHEFIIFLSKLRKLSTYNAALVRMQNSGVKHVFTASQWKKYNREVIDGARPLVILRPFGPVEFVFDIRDTEGEPLPKEIQNPIETLGDFDYNILKYTLENCLKINVAVKYSVLKNDVVGYASKYKKGFEVRVNKIHEIREQYSTLTHELAHIFLGHCGRRQDDWWKDRSNLEEIVEEIEAESVSFLVCKRVGLQTSSEAYLSNYVKENNEIPDISIDAILKAADYIETLKRKYFVPKKGKRK